MKASRWEKIQDLFESALSLASSERETYLRKHCKDDVTLYEEVISLLEADSVPHHLLEKSHQQIVGILGQPIKPGEHLAQYEVVDHVASGGMGDVFLAIDKDLNRKVALKFLPVIGAENEKDRARFLQEARIAASLNHPNVVTIHEIIEHQGRQCLVMEYVDGQSLREIISSGNLPLESKLAIAAQVSEGVLAAHKAGIVHQDLKPENILVSKEGRIKILDFGIARVAGRRGSARKTQATGTPGYMSPEQASGATVDHRSDIFSLGVILYELVSNRQPFKRASIVESIRATISERPEPLETLVPRTSAELCSIIDRCLAKHPDQRYQSVEYLNRDLNLFSGATSESIGASVTSPTGVPKIISLAILPLKSHGPIEDYIAYGVTEDLIVDVTRIGVIRVVPMRSVLPLRDSELSLKRIGRKLRVSHVLEGSIHRKNELIQISAQIVAVASEETIFANRWQTTPARIHEIERQLAEGICQAFNINPSIQMDAQIGAPVAENALAYEHYLRGKYTFNHKKDSSDVEVALGLYRRAIELEDSLIPARCGTAEVLILKGDKVHAQEELERSLAIARTKNLRGDEASVLRLLARLQTTLSKWDEALRFGEESLAISREIRDKSGEATTLGILINALLPQAQYDKALGFFQRVVEIHRSLDNQDELGEALKNMGTLYRQKGDYSEAEKYYGDALALARQQENLALESASLGNLGTVYHCRNELDRALKSYSSALEIDSKLGNKVAIQAWLPNIAHIYESQGNHRQALTHLERAKSLSKEIGDFKVYTHVLVSSADVSISMGRFEEAIGIASEAVTTAEKIGFLPGVCYARHQLGLALFWHGQHESAFVELELALGKAREGHLRRSIAWLELNAAEFHFYLDRIDEARARCAAALTEAEAIGEQSVVGHAKAYGSAIEYMCSGNIDSLADLRRMESSVQSTQDSKSLQVITRLLGQVLLNKGKNEPDRSEGREILVKALEAAKARESAPEIAWLRKLLSDQSPREPYRKLT